MFKKLWNDFKNDFYWKNIMKINYIHLFLNTIDFWIIIMFIMIAVKDNSVYNNFKLIIFFYIIIQSNLIAYSLSVFILNSNEKQQQKYRFLWLFLFIIAFNVFGVISILMLIMRKQKNEKEIIIIKNQEEPQMVNNDKLFLLWILYSSISSIILIIPIPIVIINLVNIKRNWKKELIDVKELKKMIYFSNDIILIFLRKFVG